jgi:3-hydroxy-9,10-secoandrosta-1,3,5(10)-triene-9,17-dione monooxygenase reductase component
VRGGAPRRLEFSVALDRLPETASPLRKEDLKHTPPDSTQFRKVMSRFITGVTVVTSRGGDEVQGMTCNAFCSVSVAPLIILVSLAKSTRTAKLIEKAQVFAVNVLSHSQAEISDRFAGRHKNFENDRFTGFQWTTAVTGSPILIEAQAYLDCRLLRVFDAGSHHLHLGEVVAAQVDESQGPLIFFQSQYMSLDGLKPIS